MNTSHDHQRRSQKQCLAASSVFFLDSSLTTWVL